MKNQLIKFGESLNVILSNLVMDALIERCTVRELKAGTFFHEEGEICRKVAFLTVGQVAHLHHIDGKEYVRWVSLDTSFVTSFDSFINEKKSFDSLKCLTDVTVYVLTKNDLDYHLSDFQEIQTMFSKAIAKDLSKYQSLVHQLTTISAQERYLNFQKNYPRYIQEVAQKYIANILGIEPRHLSRIRKKIASDHK